MPIDLATNASKAFLRAFRKCPENLSMSLDAWRRLLWAQALGDQYNKYAGKENDLLRLIGYNTPFWREDLTGGTLTESFLLFLTS